jgi:hypothetical protein
VRERGVRAKAEEKSEERICLGTIGRSENGFEKT